MAIMCPSTPMECDPFSREEVIFEILRDGLPDSYYVFHSLTIVFYDDFHRRRQRECDFLIFHPEKGILCIEAKAGHPCYRNREWFYGSGEKMKDGPFAQVDSFMRDMVKYVIRKKPFGDVMDRCKYLSAVWFPSVSRSELNSMELPTEALREMIICKDDAPQIETVIERMYALNVGAVNTALSPMDVKNLLYHTFAPEFKLVAITTMEHENAVMTFSRLLEEQNALLDYLDEQDRAAINGMAGTGKTLMAVEKAKRHAANGDRVLFLCYNTMLKDHLRETYPIPGVDYHTLDGYARSVCGETSEPMRSLEAYLSQCDKDKAFPYRHIIIDEGQDFGRESTEQCGIIDLLQLLVLDNDYNPGTFYIFYDKNQLVQCNVIPSAITDADCRLTLYRNCRNTMHIAKTAASILRTEKPLRLKENPVTGETPELYAATDPETLRRAVDDCLRRNLAAGLTDTVILTCATEKRSMLVESDNQRCYEYEGRKFLFTTCPRFKGLEADAVILIDADAPSFSLTGSQLAYVGASRARYRLSIVTNLSKAECAVLLEGMQRDPGRNPYKSFAAVYQAKFVTLKG